MKKLTRAVMIAATLFVTVVLFSSLKVNAENKPSEEIATIEDATSTALAGVAVVLNKNYEYNDSIVDEALSYAIQFNNDKEQKADESSNILEEHMQIMQEPTRVDKDTFTIQEDIVQVQQDVSQNQQDVSQNQQDNVLEQQDIPTAQKVVVLTPSSGRVNGPSGCETYYNLPMNKIIEKMGEYGYTIDDYAVREDGVKTLGGYVMVAANLEVHPRGSTVPTSLGIGLVCDTGDFAIDDPYALDIAVTW